MQNELGMMAEDGNEFGNRWTTELTLRSGEVLYYDGERPVKFFGVHGLVRHGDEYLLLSEDDGAFWTEASLTLSDLLTLKGLVGKLKSEFKITSQNRDRLDIIDKTSFRFKREHELFPIEVEEIANANHLIHISVNKNELVFDSFWLFDLYKVLDINMSDMFAESDKLIDREALFEKFLCLSPEKGVSYLAVDVIDGKLTRAEPGGMSGTLTINQKTDKPYLFTVNGIFTKKD